MANLSHAIEWALAGISCLVLNASTQRLWVIKYTKNVYKYTNLDPYVQCSVQSRVKAKKLLQDQTVRAEDKAHGGLEAPPQPTAR